MKLGLPLVLAGVGMIILVGRAMRGGSTFRSRVIEAQYAAARMAAYSRMLAAEYAAREGLE